MIYYDLKITGKDVKRFINGLSKMHINLYDIKYYDKSVIIKVNRLDYLKIKKIKTIYNIKIIKYYGVARINYFIYKYKLFLSVLVIGFIFFLFLTNVIFEVEVSTNNKELKEMILDKLKENKISKYNMVVSFSKKEKIKEKILKEYHDKIEWLEINRMGTKYLIDVEERKKIDNDNSNIPRDIVAKKNGIITKITSESGEVVGKIDHYVKKGDILISGTIHKKDDIVGCVKANGLVLAETWYTVSVSLPYHYSEEIDTKNYEYIININFLNSNKELFSFKKYNSYKYNDLYTIKNYLLPMSISLTKKQEIIKKDRVYTIENAYFKASSIAKTKLLEKIGKDSQIIFEKKLKTNEINSKIEVVIFYKVIENITAYQDIKDEEIKTEIR